MNCEYAEKVSFLVDGELDMADAELVRNHIDGCEECRSLEQDFLFFRRRINETAANGAEIPELTLFQPERRRSFWKRRLSFPAPVFAGSVLVLLAAAFIAVFVLRRGAEPGPTAMTPAPERTAHEISLARFDGGGRAEIYIDGQPGGQK